LLTDEPVAAIEERKRSGDARRSKEELIRRIIVDFHGPEAAVNPKDQMKVVRPSDWRVNRIVVAAGAAPSVTRADELFKSGAVEISLDGSEAPITGIGTATRLEAGGYVLRVGKKLFRVVAG
jgi:tyrosyl-tRNA synthetase